MNQSKYHKPWLSTEEQLDQLIQRGMIVTDRAKARDYLEQIGYYRLSGYWTSGLHVQTVQRHAGT